jgi:hypothetical protein
MHAHNSTITARYLSSSFVDGPTAALDTTSSINSPCSMPLFHCRQMMTLNQYYLILYMHAARLLSRQRVERWEVLAFLFL